MSNRLLINIMNIIDWLNEEANKKSCHKATIRFLKQAIIFLQPAIEELRGKDINQIEKIGDEYSLLVVLNELIDHLDYINYRNGMLMIEDVKMARFHLDLARQTIRLGCERIPEIRENVCTLVKKIEICLKEESDNTNLRIALNRMTGTMNDLENI